MHTHSPAGSVLVISRPSQSNACGSFGPNKPMLHLVWQVNARDCGLCTKHNIRHNSKGRAMTPHTPHQAIQAGTWQLCLHQHGAPGERVRNVDKPCTSYNAPEPARVVTKAPLSSGQGLVGGTVALASGAPAATAAASALHTGLCCFHTAS